MKNNKKLVIKPGFLRVRCIRIKNVLNDYFMSGKELVLKSSNFFKIYKKSDKYTINFSITDYFLSNTNNYYFYLLQVKKIYI